MAAPYRWVDELVRTGWIRRGRLSPTALRLIFALGSFMNGRTSEAWPGVDQLVRLTGCKRTAVFAAIAELELAGLILVSSRTVPGKYRVYERNVYSLRSVPVLPEHQSGISDHTFSHVAEHESGKLDSPVRIHEAEDGATPVPEREPETLSGQLTGKRTGKGELATTTPGELEHSNGSNKSDEAAMNLIQTLAGRLAIGTRQAEVPRDDRDLVRRWLETIRRAHPEMREQRTRETVKALRATLLIDEHQVRELMADVAGEMDQDHRRTVVMGIIERLALLGIRITSLKPRGWTVTCPPDMPREEVNRILVEHWDEIARLAGEDVDAEGPQLFEALPEEEQQRVRELVESGEAILVQATGSKDAPVHFVVYILRSPE